MKRTSLSQAFSDFQGWKGHGSSSFDQEVVKSLALDDYLNQSYSNGSEIVNLYIGYYLTLKKVGAAHSPLVCFPGQGWVVSDKTTKEIKTKDGNIDLAVMLVTRGQEKNLVLYWFQAFDKTCPGTFLQKIYTFWAKVMHCREDNAFVRVTVDMNGRSMEEAYEKGQNFIKAFYPRFLEYVKDKV